MLWLVLFGIAQSSRKRKAVNFSIDNSEPPAAEIRQSETTRVASSYSIENNDDSSVDHASDSDEEEGEISPYLPETSQFDVVMYQKSDTGYTVDPTFIDLIHKSESFVISDVSEELNDFPLNLN
jgi:hypothetical protein